MGAGAFSGSLASAGVISGLQLSVQGGGRTINMVSSKCLGFGGTTTNFPGLFMGSSNTNLLQVQDAAGGNSGSGLIIDALYFNPSPLESSTNTLLYSQGTNLVVSDSLTALGLGISSNSLAQVPANANTIGGMYLYNSNGTHLYLLVSSPASVAWTSTNKLFGP